MNGIQWQQRRIVLHALMRVGSMAMPYFRQPKDANGMPSGEWYQAGTLFGITYKNRSSGHMQIDIPGIVVRNDNQRHAMGLIEKGLTPQSGDHLFKADGTLILDADKIGVVYDLILES